ncbi:ribosome maturation factor RimP [Brachybacterium sp. EF45031]|uniref:ribosome maturation factor RimP n=1 Tax=Brachybacterium sillae TaxID=2810536 RepID=UPI00217D5500|nr:ribosome maturation factor RimP [Brachybacterium sillae]MCS6712346.1 ribosome maturation factor RimP [Brachybacterium sillae]
MTSDDPHGTAAQLRERVDPLLRDRGLLVEDVTVRPGATTTAVITVDLAGDEPGGVDSDILADVSREISDLVETEDLLGAGPSLLEVTTPGAERPLTTLRHARRSRGRLVRVQVRDGHDLSGEPFLARLEDATEDGVLTLAPRRDRDAKGRPIGRRLPPQVQVDFADLASARVEVDLSGATSPDAAPTGGTPTPDDDEPGDAPAKER